MAQSSEAAAVADGAGPDAPMENPAPHVMDSDIKPWDLYSLEGADEPETLDTLKGYFTRYRATRSKTTNNAYTHDAWQRSWCAFIAGTRCDVSGSPSRHGSRRVKSGGVNTKLLRCEPVSAIWHSRRGASATCTCGKATSGVLKFVIGPRAKTGTSKLTCGGPLMKSVAGSGATSVLSRSGRNLKSVVVAIVAVPLAATIRVGLAVEVGFVVAIVRQRRVRASAATREIVSGGRIDVRCRQSQRGLVVTHHVRDIFKQAATRLP
ncbi:hypothetical protein PI124_g11028 [Phytophthora idaei]|nr:hypothetical protein PI125_g20458 [Phytophthora idaei]KAG3122818.1 hypothetical protein PI126_g23984 [Phytophthora idaei]KAG3244199.1 hypothetical protein PI124_g11028 [Phytophthora idaei]